MLKELTKRVGIIIAAGVIAISLVAPTPFAHAEPSGSGDDRGWTPQGDVCEPKNKACLKKLYKKHYKFKKWIKNKVKRKVVRATTADLGAMGHPDRPVGTCYIASGSTTASSVANIELFTIYLSAKYCFNGKNPKSVRYVESDYKLQAPLLWRGDGLKKRNSGISWDTRSARSYVKYKFIAGSWGIDIANVEHCVRLIMKTNSAALDHTCSVHG